MDRASEPIHALKPVTFRYKKEIDSTGTSQFELVHADDKLTSFVELESAILAYGEFH
jgi:hypothetical protein